MATSNQIAVFVSSIFLAVIAFFTFLMSPPASAMPGVIAISRGEGVREVAHVLDEMKLIRSRAAFSLYAIFSGSAHRLKPGAYHFEGNLGVPATLKKLVVGPVDEEVLVTEGDALKDIEARLVEMAIIEPGALTSTPVDDFREEYPFLGSAKTFEGFLFPDTYRFTPGSTGPAVVRKFLDNFKTKIPANPSEIKSGRFYRDLILASLIEREVPDSEDRRIVAGILNRRLAIGMALQIDATVIYAKCEGRIEGCPPLTRSDFALQSLFNTYVVPGIPPAPIANPGLNAFAAMRAPRTSPYLYYLSDPETGKTIFAETLEEHNTNRARYLKR